MNKIVLSESLAVSAQIAPEDVTTIAAAGYKVIVNNRPDGEDPGQPTSAEIAALAEAEGLEYYHMPVTPMDFPGADFQAFTRLLDNPDKPVFAYCRSGTRCANLWVSSRTGSAVTEAAGQAQALGFDLGLAARHLQS
ncbi:MAG: TIGR01244 family sulfur transferase [Gammaproteobacteria bacterium]|jgi:uncharacterized protein (TIGR01244 family)|nr:TIGR01244 family sulfur transferase [Gammaproteobacteria bacterium]